MLELDLDKAVKAVKDKGAGKVAVQIPEGLKTRALEIAEKLEKEAGCEVFTFIEPCYGACDLADAKAKQLGAEMLLHFGHTRFLAKEELPVAYIPLHYSVKKAVLAGLAEKTAEKKPKQVVVCTTAQYLHLLPEFKKMLESKGLKVFAGKGNGVEQGQVLGCNYSAVKEVAEKATAIVFLGDGLFHPLGISFCCSKPVYTANPLTGELKELKGERELFLKKRSAAIARAMDAKSFGILLSTKKGQLHSRLALKLKKKIEAKGRKAFIFSANFIRAEDLLGIKVEALVSTACPRIALDDASSFRQPLLSPSELLVVLGEKKFEEYGMEEFS